MADDRSVPRQPHEGGHRRSVAAERVLHRRRERRRVEDDRLRPHVESDLRRPSRPARSARSPSRRPIRTSSTSEAARGCSAPTSRPATASTSRPTPERRGRTSVFATGSRSRRSSSTRAIRIGCSSPCSAIRTGLTRSAASSARPMAARRSRRFSTRTRTPARIDVVLDPAESAHASTPCCGKRARRRGRTARSAGRAAGCSSRPMAARRGGRSARACRRSSSDGLGRIGIGIAPSMPVAMFATVDAARNGGSVSLRRRRRDVHAGDDGRCASSSRASDFAEVKVDPKNPDIVYTASIVAWKSTDGGKTFKALRGAPGGDDYHRIWINPDNPTSSCSSRAIRARSSP